MINWVQQNWPTISIVGTLALTVFATIAVKWIDFYGKDYPAAKRFLGFLLSLLSWLPAKSASGAGVRLVVGNAEVTPPLVSWSTRTEWAKKFGGKK